MSDFNTRKPVQLETVLPNHRRLKKKRIFFFGSRFGFQYFSSKSGLSFRFDQKISVLWVSVRTSLNLNRLTMLSHTIVQKN